MTQHNFIPSVSSPPLLWQVSMTTSPKINLFSEREKCLCLIPKPLCPRTPCMTLSPAHASTHHTTCAGLHHNTTFHRALALIDLSFFFERCTTHKGGLDCKQRITELKN